MENDARAGHRVAHAVAHVVIEAAQNIGRAHDLGDLGAEALKERCEFDRDIAAADDQQPAREDRKIEDLVRGDRVFEAFNFLRQHRT